MPLKRGLSILSDVYRCVFGWSLYHCIGVILVGKLSFVVGFLRFSFYHSRYLLYVLLKYLVSVETLSGGIMTLLFDTLNIAIHRLSMYR